MAEHDRPKDRPQVRPFAAVLQELARGRVHAELSEALADVVAAVVETGRKGSLQLTITVGPLSKNDTDTLAVAAEVTPRPPKQPAPASVFFPDEAGNLHRNDPRQPTLPLRGVPTTSEETQTA